MSMNSMVINKRVNHNGYIEIYLPIHHRARGNGYVFEHILIAESGIGRKLKENEIVHHINDDKKDNRLLNLKVMDRGDHTTLHAKERRRGSYLKCEMCNKEYYKKTSHVKGSKFCSMRCNGKSSDIGNLNNKHITKEALVDSLNKNNWDKKATAKELGVHWSTVYKNIKKLGVDC